MSWLLPIVSGALLTVLIGLVGYIGRVFDRRLAEFERLFSEKIGELKVVLERGERHEAAIGELNKTVTDLRISVAALVAPSSVATRRKRP